MRKRFMSIGFPIIASLFLIAALAYGEDHAEGETQSSPEKAVPATAPQATVEPVPFIAPPIPEEPLPFSPDAQKPAPQPQPPVVPSPDVPTPATEPQQPQPQALPSTDAPTPAVEPPASQPPASETLQTQAPAPMTPPATEPAQPLPPPVEGSVGPNTFEGKGLGYKITYPVDWVYEAPTQYQIIFSGKQGSPAYYSTVSVQNVASTKLGGKHDSMESVKNSLFEQLKSSDPDVKIYDEKPYIHDRSDKPPLAGVEFMAEYTNNKERFKQWVIIVERPGKEVYHIWSYTSPIAQYDEYLTIGRDMLDSWMVQ